MTNDFSSRVERYRRVIDVSLDLASTLDLNELLKRINRLAVELTNAEASSILLYDERKNQLYFAVADKPEIEAALSSVIVPSESIAGWVATHRQAAFVPDVQQDQRFFRNVEQMLNFQTHSIMATPMLIKGRLIGVLEALNKQNGPFTEEDLEMLMVLSAQAAVAIENSRLFQQGDLINELVHEIRTPLSSINTISYLLQRPDVSETQRQELSSMIQKEVQRLNDLTNTFLDYSRLESGRMRFASAPFDLAGLIEECVRIVSPQAVEKGVRLEKELTPNLPTFDGDRDKLKQVLLNLLSNAIKYNRPRGDVTLKLWSNQEIFSISVSDTGVGIPPEDLPHIGERFFRAGNVERKITGTGLGLSICKHIVEAHAGQMHVTSQINQGTTFTIELPMKRPA
jgi:signal transduction histidine kinase